MAVPSMLMALFIILVRAFFDLPSLYILFLGSFVGILAFISLILLFKVPITFKLLKMVWNSRNIK